MLSERSTIRVSNPSYTAAGDIAGGCPDTYVYVTNLVEEFGCKPSMSVKDPDSYQRFTGDVLYEYGRCPIPRSATWRYTAL